MENIVIEDMLFKVVQTSGGYRVVNKKTGKVVKSYSTYEEADKAMTYRGCQGRWPR